VDEEPEERLGKDHVGVFAKDLPWLMYGFGDADKPLKVSESFSAGTPPYVPCTGTSGGSNAAPGAGRAPSGSRPLAAACVAHPASWPRTLMPSTGRSALWSLSSGQWGLMGMCPASLVLACA
jgi:hypothetical protein